jgi:hypothetical protein
VVAFTPLGFAALYRVATHRTNGTRVGYRLARRATSSTRNVSPGSSSTQSPSSETRLRRDAHLFNCSARLRSDLDGLIQSLADLLGVDHERVRMWMLARAAAEPRPRFEQPRIGGTRPNQFLGKLDKSVRPLHRGPREVKSSLVGYSSLRDRSE